MKKKYFYVLKITFFIIIYSIFTTSSFSNTEENFTTYYTSLTKNHFDVQANYHAEKNNENTSNIFYNVIINWIQKINKYKIWGETSKNFSENYENCSKKKQIGIRIEHNNNDNEDYYFFQEEWLIHQNYERNIKNTILIGKGKQLFSNSAHNLQIEFGPGIFFEKCQRYDQSKKFILYGSACYSYQITKNAKFIQNIYLLTQNDPSLKSKSTLNIDITDNISLKLTHHEKWNKNFFENLSEFSEKKTTLSLFYNINF
ncbi:DUF481 domain-containing protein [Candidatus Westeberhardia cardiocondylae]|nr:DUF481 domain-containing protein [Candidatus Westeberhardia cardiocondylae]